MDPLESVAAGVIVLGLVTASLPEVGLSQGEAGREPDRVLRRPRTIHFGLALAAAGGVAWFFPWTGLTLVAAAFVWAWRKAE